MQTFKQFFEAEQMGGAPSLPQQQPGADQPPVQQSNKMKGTISDGQKRVLAILSANAMKSSPGRAREVLTGDANMVQAVKTLLRQFKAVDVAKDGITINQTGVTLAQNNGITDPNSGELTQIGTELATTLPNGTANPKTKDLAGAGPAAGGMPPMGGDPMMGGMPPMESFGLLKKMLG
jgi:hypothetical protein